MRLARVLAGGGVFLASCPMYPGCWGDARVRKEVVSAGTFCTICALWGWVGLGRVLRGVALSVFGSFDKVFGPTPLLRGLSLGLMWRRAES